MRRSLGVATFFIVGAGAAGAGALNNVQLKGSDTLFEITTDLLAVCPGADPLGTDGLTYFGAGSSNGENAMRTAGVAPNPQQTVAPMSRFFAAGPAGATCTVGATGGGAFGAPSTAEGLVIGMDGLSVFAARANGGSPTCNGSLEDCDANTESGAGLAFNATVSTTAGNYVFNNWRDVLRVVFGGMDHSSGNNIALRNCNSPVRQAVVANYNALFQTPANCTTAACTQLRHAFIRDNESGTTDTFVSLLGLTGINIANRVSPFCNALRTSDALPGAAGEVIRYFPDFQDFDPIRRTCATTEQVCHKNGNNIIGANRYGLGVVLTVTPTDFITTTAAFPTTLCQAGNFAYAPLVPQSIVFTPNNRCPNGDVAAFDSNCMYPRTVTNSYKCLNSIANRPSFVLNNALVEGREPSLADGRTYNLHLLKDPVAPSIDPTYEADLRNRRIVGAFYRIHTTTSIATAPAVQCQNRDATSQIGCLVSASPCSIGFAGRGAAGDYTATAALKIKGLHPSAECIGSVIYPLSRKLFINTFQGFEDPEVAGHELALVKCASIAAGPTGINLILENRGFIPLPATAPGGAPYCEDFNETQCAGAANVNACTGNPSGVPSLGTVCGNGGPAAGDEEFGEQCDDGNNLNGDGCNANCQLEN